VREAVANGARLCGGVPLCVLLTRRVPSTPVYSPGPVCRQRKLCPVGSVNSSRSSWELVPSDLHAPGSDCVVVVLVSGLHAAMITWLSTCSPFVQAAMLECMALLCRRRWRGVRAAYPETGQPQIVYEGVRGRVPAW
jgi:hypothetical protein